MLIRCTHGYFTFRESTPGDVSKFMSLFSKIKLVAKDDYYTFSFLKDAKEYSILASPYLGIPALSTFAGDPGEVLRANKLVYDFNIGRVVPIAAVAGILDIDKSANYYLSKGLIMPGAITVDGKVITDYIAWFSFSRQTFKYSEIKFA